MTKPRIRAAASPPVSVRIRSYACMLGGLPPFYFFTASFAAASSSADHHFSESVRCAWLTPTTTRSVARDGPPVEHHRGELGPPLLERAPAGSHLPGLQDAIGIEDVGDHRELLQLDVGEIRRRVQQHGRFGGTDVQDLRVLETNRRIRRLHHGGHDVGHCGAEQRHQRCREKGHPASCPDVNCITMCPASGRARAANRRRR